MTALILSTFTTHDGTTKARIKIGREVQVVPAPFGSKEGDWLKLVDGQWRLTKRDAA